MNLYTAADHAKAEIVLATEWAKSAAAEGHRRALPKSAAAEGHRRALPKSADKSKNTEGRPARTGLIAELRKTVAGLDWTFSVYDIEKLMPGFKLQSLSQALLDMVVEGRIARVGIGPMGVRIYERVSA